MRVIDTMYVHTMYVGDMRVIHTMYVGDMFVFEIALDHVISMWNDVFISV